jgi:dolichol-phosphate mannosyltransferase
VPYALGVKVSWVIPCYQEADALDAGLEAILACPADEIVLVDDGSTDGTAARLERAARSDPRVRVATHARNRGVGAAMRTGFAAATGDVIVAYDADRTYPAADAARLVEALRTGADVATATPFAPGGRARVGRWRRVLSWGASALYRAALSGRAGGVRTFTCGVRAYRGALARSLDFRSDGFPATAEILGLLLLGGATVVEVPSTLSTRTEGRSKMRALRAALGHLRVAMRLADRRLAGGRKDGTPRPVTGS